MLRSLRKEGYNQVEIDHLFQSLVLPKISYRLLVYAASVPELACLLCFLVQITAFVCETSLGIPN